MPYDAAIVTRLFSTVYDNALQLGGAAYTRKMALGGAWQRIRLGALVSVAANGTSNINDPIFTLGLTSSTSLPGSANNGNGFGFSFNGSPVVGTARTLTYAANSGYPYFSCTNGVVYRKPPYGGYTVSASGGAVFLPLTYVGTQKRRFPVYVDITRGAGTGATVTIYGVAVAGTAQLDFRPDHFQDGLDQIGTPTIYNTAISAGTTLSTIGFGEEFGTMDTFELFWSNATFPLEIHALGAVVINPFINSATLQPYSISTPGGAHQTMTQTYAPATQIISFSADYGTNFLAGGTITGFAAGTLFVNLPGTSGGTPVDTFEQYTTGSIVSGVTLNAGYWGGYGTIY